MPPCCESFGIPYELLTHVRSQEALPHPQFDSCLTLSPCLPQPLPEWLVQETLLIEPA